MLSFLNGVLRIQAVWEFMTAVEGEDKEENVHLQTSRRMSARREREHVRWVRMRMFRREEKAVKREENGSSVFKNQPHLRAKEPKRERNPPSNSASVSSKQ